MHGVYSDVHVFMFLHVFVLISICFSLALTRNDKSRKASQGISFRSSISRVPAAKCFDCVQLGYNATQQLYLLWSGRRNKHCVNRGAASAWSDAAILRALARIAHSSQTNVLQPVQHQSHNRSSGCHPSTSA